MSEQFNQQTYIQKYNKDHYKAFKVDLKKEEYMELECYLKKNKLTKASFLRMAIQEITKKEGE